MYAEFLHTRKQGRPIDVQACSRSIVTANTSLAFRKCSDDLRADFWSARRQHFSCHSSALRVSFTIRARNLLSFTGARFLGICAQANRAHSDDLNARAVHFRFEGERNVVRKDFVAE